MSAIDPPGDEPFFARWSRRKQQTKTSPLTVAPVADAPVSDDIAPAHLAVEPAPAASPVALADPQAKVARDEPDATKVLTEADFADVDFETLEYGSDYGRFMQAGVPENIRQKALTKLWHSDPMFTQVDPYQDYAGDYTDAAMVPAAGLLKTAYKVGQGFLSDEEAHVWDRLGKPPLSDAMTALPVLRPGYRVRSVTAADFAGLLAVQTAAILGPGAEAYGPALAQSWAHGLTADGYQQSINGGGHFELTVDEASGVIVGFCGTLAGDIKGLFVDPRHGRKGLGGLLLARAEAALRAAGFETAMVLATRTAQALYCRRGYQLVSTLSLPTRGGLAQEVFQMAKRLALPTDLRIARETPDQPEIRAFFAASEAYMGALYPAASNHFVPASALLEPNVIFLVARAGAVALGCGAIVVGDDGCAEIKRMWVAPAARGLKLGARLLAALCVAARAANVACLRLETGTAQPEALALYRAAGFIEIGPFGTYQADPLSLFMELTLDPQTA